MSVKKQRETAFTAWGGHAGQSTAAEGDLEPAKNNTSCRKWAVWGVTNTGHEKGKRRISVAGAVWRWALALMPPLRLVFFPVKCG